MEEKTIDRIADICTSPQVHIHHFGETLLCLDTALYAVKALRKKNIAVVVNTNGSMCSPRRVWALFDAGLDRMVISWHPEDKRVGESAKNSLGGKESSSTLHLAALANTSPGLLSKIEITRVVSKEEEEAAQKEMEPYAKMGYRCSLKRLRNLGQVYSLGEGEKRPKYCSFLDENEFAVLWDGRIVVCCECYDVREGWVVGNVFDENLPTVNPGCSLCVGCLGYGGLSEETERVEVTGV
jgi:hypothetical protein